MTAVGEELYVLTGGMPKTVIHPFVPSLFIDVFGWDGQYHRSYKLPQHADAFDTDGQLFYIVQSGNPYPRVIVLRPSEPQSGL